MQNEWFLALCNSHNRIIHEFGSDNLCGLTACICLKGCSQHEHTQKNTRHKFVDARQFYSVVGGVRQRYSSFENDFKQVYLKSYVSELKEAVANFEQYILGDFMEKNPLVEIFCRYNSAATETVQSVITDETKDLQLAELHCKEVNHLRQFGELLRQETQEEQQKRMTKLLSRIFQFYLRGRKLLDSAKKVDARSLLEHERVGEVAAEMEKRLVAMDEAHVEKLEGVEELLIKIGEDITVGKPEVEVYDRFYSVLERYVGRVAPEALTLAVKSSLVQHPFWERLVVFAVGRGLKNLTVVTTCEESESKYLQRQLGKLKLLRAKVVYCARWDQQREELFYKK